MSRTFNKLVQAAAMEDPEMARQLLDAAARNLHKKPDFYKGIDMAERVLLHLRGELPLEELQPPIFSIKRDKGEMLGFANVFGVDSMEAVGQSPRLPAGFAVAYESVTDRYELTERELDFMIGRLPGVRIRFVAPEAG